MPVGAAWREGALVALQLTKCFPSNGSRINVKWENATIRNRKSVEYTMLACMPCIVPLSSSSPNPSLAAGLHAIVVVACWQRSNISRVWVIPLPLYNLRCCSLARVLNSFWHIKQLCSVASSVAKVDNDVSVTCRLWLVCLRGSFFFVGFAVFALPFVVASVLRK